jgi:hypothetical protein
VSNRSAKFLLIEDRLGSSLSELIRKRKDDGDSYEVIARYLWATTGVDVTAQTVSNWHSSPTTEQGAA